VDELKLPVVHSGPAIALSPPKSKKPPWSDRHSVFILAVLVLAVGVMLYFIIKNLRKIRAETGER
jgi:hypothetical protein